jgi:ketosteroid isomerase-like protein
MTCPGEESPMSAEDLKALRPVYDAMLRWDFDDLMLGVAHDIEWDLPEAVPWGGIRHGRDGIASLADIFQEHVDGAWADPDDFLDAGDRVVVLGRTRGRARSSGQEYEVAFAHVWRMSDGVPSGFRAYFDTAPILAALEMGESP